MNRIANLFRTLLIASNALAFGATGALAGASAAVQPVAPEHEVMVQADCYAIGEQVAADNGGTLAGATPSTQGGQAVCVVVVLIPGKDGERPRRERFVVPAN